MQMIRTSDQDFNQGFTLIELMVVVVILGIVSVIAIGSYVNYTTEARRAAGKAMLLDLAAKMETYYTAHNSYAGATLKKIDMPAMPKDGFYKPIIKQVTATTFTIEVTPQGRQADADAGCGSLTYNQLGEKGVTGADLATDCW